MYYSIYLVYVQTARSIGDYYINFTISYNSFTVTYLDSKYLKNETPPINS